MIGVELYIACDAPACAVVVCMDSTVVIPGSDREQYVRVPSDLPDGWRIDTAGNLFCPSHALVQ